MRLAVFDLDGTVVDSQSLIVAAVSAVWRDAGMSPPEADTVRRVVGLSLVEAMARLHPEGAVHEHEALAQRYKAAFAEARAVQSGVEPLFPGIADALQALDRAGTLLGIATGKGMTGLRNVLDHHGLAGRVVTLQTPDHSPGKPHPGMLERALAETGVRRQNAVMIGDTTYDMEMARNAGVAGLGVAWGYHPAEELRAAGAQEVAPDAAALVKLVEELWAAA